MTDQGRMTLVHSVATREGTFERLDMDMTLFVTMIGMFGWLSVENPVRLRRDLRAFNLERQIINLVESWEA